MSRRLAITGLVVLVQSVRQCTNEQAQRDAIYMDIQKDYGRIDIFHYIRKLNAYSFAMPF